MGMIPCRYMIPQTIQQAPPPVRTAEHPAPVKTVDHHQSVRKQPQRRVQIYEDEDEPEDDYEEEEEYEKPSRRRRPPQNSKNAPLVQSTAVVQEENEEDEDKPKDPTARLKKMVKRSKDFKNIRKRLTARGEVYRPNRKREQPLELASQEGGAFPALLIPALTALAPFAGEVAKDVYNAIKRKIKGDGSVRQKMGRRLKTKQERLDFVVELLKKLKL